MISFITTSFGFIDELIVPLRNSIERYIPDAEFIFVDQEDRKCGRTRSLNAGAKLAAGDWLCFLDSDVLCIGTPEWNFPRDGMYGTDMKARTHLDFNVDFDWPEAWILLFPREVFFDMGMWDENLILSGSFSDIDMALSAKKCGYEVKELTQPCFGHRRLATKTIIDPNHWNGSRDKNMAYIKKKWNI